MSDTSMGFRPKKWNIFARELEGILQDHGFRLGHLNDRAQIHPEKVRRLQRSLYEPKFNVLSPDDLEQVRVSFGFTKDEQTRLRAAILATAVEDMLMGRINVDDALGAAEQIFPLLLRALRAHDGEEGGIGAIKGAPVPAQPSELDVFEGALDDIDEALLALHLTGTTRNGQRVEYACRARDGFSAALVKLDTLAPTHEADPKWRMWQAEASNGLVAAERKLRSLQSGLGVG